MSNIPDWDTYFMQLARDVASRSKDQSTRIGAVIVGPDKEIRSTGYNSFPRGVIDSIPARQDRPLKYLWMEHAERNAIYNAARMGTSLKGCTMYVSHWPPCPDCARAISQSGLSCVVVETFEVPERWAEHMDIAAQILKESGVLVRKIEAVLG